jgi:hypothetical protein
MPQGTKMGGVNACIEGDDVPPERIRVFMYSDNFVSIDGGDLSMSASGPGCLAVAARKMLAVGFSPNRELDLIRGGDHVERVLLRDAAGESR